MADETFSPPGQRIDLWLWQTRFFKSRTLAAALVAEGRVRVNGQPVSKPARTVTPGDVLTLPQGGTIRVVKILALPTRRGPAPEAQACYADFGGPERLPIADA
jgi:ribosome-associated heat shock protein Hsp15